LIARNAGFQIADIARASPARAFFLAVPVSPFDQHGAVGQRDGLGRFRQRVAGRLGAVSDHRIEIERSPPSSRSAASVHLVALRASFLWGGALRLYLPVNGTPGLQTTFELYGGS
jgi:hypothetical protein